MRPRNKFGEFAQTAYLPPKLREHIAMSRLGNCEICGVFTALVKDHDHTSKTIRGKLCQVCNRGLGHFHDDPALLEKALEYLRKWKLKDLF